jgi:3',5'-cyclic AMP phosphodiesterase CpdA
MAFSLAHFSDVHLGPLPKGSTFSNFSAKRFVGALSWHFNRKKIHQPAIALALVEDIKNNHPDHVAFTGDVVNIAAFAEFSAAAAWIKNIGPSDKVSYVPGNHDAYVRVAWDKTLGLFEEYMSSDMRQEHLFPYIRLRRNIALFGVNGATPQSWTRAGGEVGPAQRQRLSEKLKSLREQGFYRAVMIHHPPAPGLAHPLRSLSDAAELKAVLEQEGADLVMHGHNHTQTLNWLESKHGSVPIVGVPSASMVDDGKHQAASWNNYKIDRAKGKWQTHLTIRQWQGKEMSFKTVSEFKLAKPL